MRFEGQYLTYAEYQSLGGSAIGETPFNLLEFEARRQIDGRTKNRLVGITTIPNEVKICVYNLINLIKSYNIDNDRNISSETVGSYSVSYGRSISELIQGKDIEITDVIINDLYGLIINNEHVLYIGDV